jgi:hypothetical protein
MSLQEYIDQFRRTLEKLPKNINIWKMVLLYSLQYLNL